MKFIVSLIAVYVYFSFALADALKGLSYYRPVASVTLISENTGSGSTVLAKTGEKTNASGRGITGLYPKEI